MRLVLASASPRRRELLETIGVAIDRIAPPSIVETRLPGEEPAGYARRMAEEKAATVPCSSDEIVLADGNFPAATHAKRLVRADGHGVPEILAAIAPLFPLDAYVDDDAVVMATVEDSSLDSRWEEYDRAGQQPAR